jgi:hypothetical protein
VKTDLKSEQKKLIPARAFWHTIPGVLFSLTTDIRGNDPMTLLLIELVILAVCCVSAIAFVLSCFEKWRKETSEIARQTAEETVKGHWPHPIVGNVVAYASDPHQPIGEVVHVDGSGRARIRRYGFDGYVRRSLSRLVIWRMPEFDDPAIDPRPPENWTITFSPINQSPIRQHISATCGPVTEPIDPAFDPHRSFDSWEHNDSATHPAPPITNH